MVLYPDADQIIKATSRIAGYINKTPVFINQAINDLAGCNIYFKCENLQKAGVFKSRGAINAVYSLNEDELKHGVATHSSGNHAAALSMAAGLRRTKAYVVMPENSNLFKIKAVQSYHGNIIFCKPTLHDRESTLLQVIDKTHAIEIHPYNNIKIIEGQATAAKELIEEVPDLDIIMAPVGGGGLLSGTALSAHYFGRNIEVIAGEPEGADDAARSFISRTMIPSVSPNTIADGLLTSLGTITFEIITRYVNQILTVSDTEIIKAMRMIWEQMKIIIETSSAVPFAALMNNKTHFKGKNVGIILSGGNVDIDNLPF